MRVFALTTLFLLFLFPPKSKAGLPADTTLYVRNGSVSLSYRLRGSGQNQVLEFSNIFWKNLHLGKGYKDDISQLRLVFFENIQSYDDGTSFHGMSPRPVKTSDITFPQSGDKYHLLGDNEYNKVEFHLHRSSGSLEIPLYLAYYKKKKEYELVAECGELKIPVDEIVHSPKAEERGRNVPKPEIEKVVTYEVVDGGGAAATGAGGDYSTDPLQLPVNPPNYESVASGGGGAVGGTASDPSQLPSGFPNYSGIGLDGNSGGISGSTDGGGNVDKKAALLISVINKELRKENPNVPSLESKTNDLFDIQSQIIDPELQTQAQSTMDRFDKCKEAYEAKQDSIKTSQELEAEKDKKRNFWMILGGVALAVLGFIGNQVMQVVRNRRTLQSMTNMQGDLVNKAKQEAQRRARNATNGTVNRVLNETVGKGERAVRRKVSDVMKASGVAGAASVAQQAARKAGVSTPVIPSTGSVAGKIKRKIKIRKNNNPNSI